MEAPNGITNEYPFQPRPQIPRFEQIKPRVNRKVEVKDIEREPMKYIALALIHMRMQLESLAIKAADFSKPVDEYLTQEFSLTEAIGQAITLQPQYEVPEIITSIVITGPTAAASCTLQLGDRFWNIGIPNTGVVTIAPVAIMLARTDLRQLVPNTAGNWSFELMGHADTRGSLI